MTNDELLIKIATELEHICKTSEKQLAVLQEIATHLERIQGGQLARLDGFLQNELGSRYPSVRSVREKGLRWQLPTELEVEPDPDVFKAMQADQQQL